MQYIALCMAKAKTRSNTVTVVNDMINRDYDVKSNEIVANAAAAQKYQWKMQLGKLGCKAPYSDCSYKQYRSVCGASIEIALPVKRLLEARGIEARMRLAAEEYERKASAAHGAKNRKVEAAEHAKVALLETVAERLHEEALAAGIPEGEH